jgi:hypothetical protein
MIQWRNLNFDPVKYWQRMDRVSSNGKPLGMRNLLQQIKTLFPHVRYGYFNPPKEAFGRASKDRFLKKRGAWDDSNR